MKSHLIKSLTRPMLLLFGLFFISELKAQKKESTFSRFYLQGAAGPTTNSGAYWDLSVQGITPKNFVATLSYSQVEMDPKNLPSDYQPGYVLLIIIPLSDGIPYVATSTLSITAGKAFKSGRNTWFSTEAGIGYVKSETMSFYKQEVISNIVSATSNYRTTTEDHSTVGAVVKADFNWAMASFMGLGFGVCGNLNSVQSFAGFHVKLMAGLMGRQKKVRRE